MIKVNNRWVGETPEEQRLIESRRKKKRLAYHRRKAVRNGLRRLVEFGFPEKIL